MTTPLLTKEQADHILALIDARLAMLANFYPEIDEALYHLQLHIEEMMEKK